MKWMILVVVMAGTALAQVPPDQAMAKLREKEAQRQAATTQPAKITQKQLEDLQSQLASLKRENAELRKSIAAVPPPASRPSDPVRAAINDHVLTIGMTVAEANEALGANGAKRGEGPSGYYPRAEQWEWAIMGYPKDTSPKVARDAISVGRGVDPRYLHSAAPKPEKQRVAIAYADVVGGKIVRYNIADLVEH